MKFVSHIALPMALGMTVLSAASFAQNPPPPHQKRERPSPEMMQRMHEGRMAMITTALKLTDDQKKLWAPVEAKMKENQEARMKRMQEMGNRQQGGAPMPMPERMERRSQMMAAQAERMKGFAAVYKPFYESLTDDQKKLSGMLMAQMGGGRRGPGGHGGGMMHHRHPGPGPQ